MRVTPTSGLSSHEIERLIAEADNAADSDRRIKEVIALRSKLETLVRNTRRTFDEFGGSLTQEERRAAQEMLNGADAAMQSQFPGELQDALKSVEGVATQLTLAMMNPSPPKGSTDLSEPQDPNERL